MLNLDNQMNFVSLGRGTALLGSKQLMMKMIFVRFILIILFVLIFGCERAGYIVTIDTNYIKYSDIQQIARMLNEKGFKTVDWEGKKYMPKYSDKVYILFEKKLGSEPYCLVDVYFDYVKDIPNDIAHNLRIDVLNIYRGMTTTELKDEIDKIGDLVYRELVDKVGKENVVMERKETPHRVIFF
jgi:hypothetical protein